MLNVSYKKYGLREAFSACTYDYCSVTHNAPSDHVVSEMAGPGFTVLNPPYFIPNLEVQSIVLSSRHLNVFSVIVLEIE